MQTLSSFTRIHSDLSLQVEGQNEVSQSPYQEPFYYLKAAACHVFLSAREMQLEIKVSFQNRVFLIQPHLLFHLKYQKPEVIKPGLSVYVMKISNLVTYDNFQHKRSVKQVITLLRHRSSFFYHLKFVIPLPRLGLVQ